MSSWFLATNPRSHLLTGLIAARPAPEARNALRNTTLTAHHRDGRTERRELAGAAELSEVLRDTFGIDAPDELEDAFERIIALAATAA